MNKFLLVFCCIFFLTFVLSGETRNIEYELRITYTPFCSPEVCVDNNSTNSTNITCSTDCFGKFKVEGINGNNLFFEIDTSDSVWSNGHTESRFGYKSTDLGNLTDISGIRDELRNCSVGWDNLFRCQNTLREMDSNLTNCLFISGADSNYTLSDCNLTNNNLQNQINVKASEISNKNKEIEEMTNDKWMFAIAGIIAGFLFFKFGVPYLKGRNTPKDPSEEGGGSNTGY